MGRPRKKDDSVWAAMKTYLKQQKEKKWLWTFDELAILYNSLAPPDKQVSRTTLVRWNLGDCLRPEVEREHVPRCIPHGEEDGWFQERSNAAKELSQAYVSSAVLWDEAWFSTRGRVQISKDEFAPPSGPSLCVIAGCSAGFLTDVHIMDGHSPPTARYYYQVVEEEMRKHCRNTGGGRLIYDAATIYHDHACWHKTEELAYFREANPWWQVKFLPLKSPDLSSCEKYWSRLKQIVYQGGRRSYRTLNALKAAIKTARDELATDSDYAQNLAHAARKACLWVRNHDGAVTSWNRPTSRNELLGDEQLEKSRRLSEATTEIQQILLGVGLQN
jgi:hypothetical protein